MRRCLCVHGYRAAVARNKPQLELSRPCAPLLRLLSPPRRPYHPSLLIYPLAICPRVIGKDWSRENQQQTGHCPTQANGDDLRIADAVMSNTLKIEAL